MDADSAADHQGHQTDADDDPDEDTDAANGSDEAGREKEMEILTKAAANSVVATMPNPMERIGDRPANQALVVAARGPARRSVMYPIILRKIEDILKV